MAKTLYFYSDVNQVSASNAFRSALQSAGLSFTELRLGQDLRKHPVRFPGIQAVIEVDGQLFEEVPIAANVQARLTAAPSTFPVSVPTVEEQDVTRDKELASAIVRKGGHNLSIADANTLITLISKYVVK